MDDQRLNSPAYRRSLLRLVPKPEPTDLTKLARREPEILDFLQFLVEHDLRQEALDLLRGRKSSDS